MKWMRGGSRSGPTFMAANPKAMTQSSCLPRGAPVLTLTPPSARLTPRGSRALTQLGHQQRVGWNGMPPSAQDKPRNWATSGQPPGNQTRGLFGTQTPSTNGHLAGNIVRTFQSCPLCTRRQSAIRPAIAAFFQRRHHLADWAKSADLAAFRYTSGHSSPGEMASPLRPKKSPELGQPPGNQLSCFPS